MQLTRDEVQKKIIRRRRFNTLGGDATLPGGGGGGPGIYWEPQEFPAPYFPRTYFP
jgi:hypothetical protein